MSYIMASQIKCGSCGLKYGNISRRIRAGWNILKYPARLKLKYVCILKSCICVKNVLKVKYTSTFNTNYGGARWID